MIAEEMGKIEMDYDCRGGRGGQGVVEMGIGTATISGNNYKREHSPKCHKLLARKGTKERETKNCNGKCAGRSGGRGVASSKNRETRQIAQSVQ